MKQFFFLLLMLAGIGATAQGELNVNVSVNAQKAQADQKTFENLATGIEEFMNNQKWTDDAFETNERIDVTMQITITDELSPTTFKATLNIQAVRPVYNSDYQTPLITHADRDLTFTYEPFQPINFVEDNFTDNLSHVLAFYAYLILGLDYDSFAPFGGEKYYQKAQNLISVFPANLSASFGGWTSQDSRRNRYWILESLLNPSVRPFREAMYNYHRQGLDLMAENVDAGKAIVMQSLETVGQVNNKYLNAMILQMFANAKATEIIEIFKVAPRQQKTRVYAIMSKVDAANASKYRAIGI